MRNKITIAAAIIFAISSLAQAADRKVIIGFKNEITQTETDKQSRIHRSRGHIKQSHRLINAVSAQLPEEEITNLKNDPAVAYVEADSTVTITDPNISIPLTQEYTDSWGVTKIGGNVAAAAGLTGAGVRVAILDSGIDYNHPDLKDNYKGGYNFAYGNSDPYDDSLNAYIPSGHGTHVAGIIAARNNGTGVVGVAPEASLYALKVLDAGLNGDVSNIIAAIEWAIANNIQVINMSIGSSIFSQALKDVCDKAAQAGIILVAAAGNYNNPYIEYPAAFGSVIAVTATAADDTRPLFNYGPEMELAAPGINIKSTIPGGNYKLMSGTSQASPHVAGAAAILLAKQLADGKPAFEAAANVRTQLDTYAFDLGDAGHDQLFGFGRVDLAKALTPPAPTKWEYTVTRTAATPKTESLNVPLAAGSYTLDITLNKLHELNIVAKDSNGLRKMEVESNRERFNKRATSASALNSSTLELTVGENASLTFIPEGKVGSSASIVITKH